MAKTLHNDNYHKAILVEDVDNLGQPLVPSGETIGSKKPQHVAEVSRKDLEGGGKVSIGTTAVEMTFSGATQSIILTADTANSGTLFVGKSDVTNTGANAITFLSAGEHIVIEYDDSSNAIFVVGSAASQNVWKGAIV